MRKRARVLYQLSRPINGLYSIYTERVESTWLNLRLIPWARDHHTQFYKSLFEGISL